MRRPEEWSEWTRGLSLTGMAEEVHMVCTGATGREDFMPCVIEDYVKAIRWAVEHWQDGLPTAARYDNAIKQVCVGVLAEWDALQKS